MTLFQLKAEAHQLIDDIIALGAESKNIYPRLARRLGISTRDAHFASMNTVSQVKRAITELEQMKSEYTLQVKLKERKLENEARAAMKKLKPVTLSQKEMREAIAKAKGQNVHKTLWFRIRELLWN